MLTKMFEHLAWADDLAREAIASLDEDSAERAQSVRIYAHLAGAAHIWLSRLEGRPPQHGVWPDLSLEAATTLSRDSLAALRAFAADNPQALARAVDYSTSTGQPFRDTVADILVHVVLHGSHHRGQLAQLARQGGGAPAITDYIRFARQ